MKTRVLFIGLLFSLFGAMMAQAQNEKGKSEQETINDSLETLSKQRYALVAAAFNAVDSMKLRRYKIIREELIKAKVKKLEDKHVLYESNIKTDLRDGIKFLNNKSRSREMPLKRELTEEEINNTKEELAEDAAEKINAHRAKTDAEIAFVKVQSLKQLQGDNNEGVAILKAFDINVVEDRQYQQRITTTSGLTLGFGYNYMSGNELDINDFSYPNNHYFSLGYQFQTAISDYQNWRVNYGLVYQSQKTELNGNRVFATLNGITQISAIGFDVDRAIFRQDQLIIPLQLEFGQSSEKKYEDGRVRYTPFKFKYGIGGFAGVNLSSRTKLHFEQDGRNVKQISVNTFEHETFVYGVDAYVGYDNVSIFGRMNLNNVFNNNSVDAQYISFGIRFQ